MNTTEDIFRRMIRPENGSFSSEMAEFFASFSFTEEELDRVDELSAKANQGTLTAEETAELDRFITIDSFVSLMQVKAKKSLQKSGA